LKTRILFLDDEPLALQGLQRMLRSHRNEWDMSFVESGPQALSLMSQARYDAVVSDMLMPGMNGAQLFDEVKRRHPQTARLILSGHADRDLIVQCLKSVHQFLSKPCQPEVLKVALARVSKLSVTLENESIRRVLGEMDRFPSVTSLYEDLVGKLQRPDIAIEEVSALMSRDMGMTAKILQLVNGGFFGVSRRVSNPAGAVSSLGLDTIRELVFTAGVFSPFESKRLGESSVELFWQHSLDTALGARAIAFVENAEKNLTEDAYAAGLLHDIGKFVLVSSFDPQYDDVLELVKAQRIDLWAAERQVFGVSHAEVGAYLLELWGLPSPVVEAVSMHHSPSQVAAKSFSALTAVHAANVLVQEQNGVPAPQLDLDYLAGLGLSGQLQRWRQAMRERLAFSPES
jgi:putative nucleotidyltransferase with HDIG domain